MRVGDGSEKKVRSAKMYMKQKGLAMDRQNLANIYLLEPKIVISFPETEAWQKKRVKKCH